MARIRARQARRRPVTLWEALGDADAPMTPLARLLCALALPALWLGAMALGCLLAGPVA